MCVLGRRMGAEWTGDDRALAWRGLEVRGLEVRGLRVPRSLLKSRGLELALLTTLEVIILLGPIVLALVCVVG